MKHLSASLPKLLAVAACALTLGSCNRAEYARFSPSSSYHGTARVAASVPVAPAPATPTTQPALPPTPAAAPAIVTAAPAAMAPMATASVVVVAPAAKPAPVASPASSAAVVVPTPPRKLNLVQRLAVAKVTKQLRKAADGTQFRQKQNAAETQRISGYLRTGIILLLVGLLIGLFNGLIGSIVALVGVIFIVLWLLDNL